MVPETQDWYILEVTFFFQAGSQLLTGGRYLRKRMDVLPMRY